MTLPADWEDGQTFTADGENAASAAVNSLMACSATSATTLTLDPAKATYVFNGAAPATWTLPPVGGNANKLFTLYSRGSAVVTVACAGADRIFGARGLVATMSLPPFSLIVLLNDGTYWLNIAN